jgi:hypothetical protein
MKVVGFSFIRNAVTYDYPFVQSINSLLPLVDEMVIAVGNSTDNTRELIAQIPTTKIKIIDTVWDDTLAGGGLVLAVETNKAFAAVAADADWAFYLQGDECIHEKDYDAIKKAMEDNLHNKKVDGLLFGYHHFYGNYNYIGGGKQWYRNEIRIIRNNKNIISWKDAQGFRFSNQQKLSVKKIEAYIYHYGWVKHPKFTQKKALNFIKLHNANFKATEEDEKKIFNYHNIDKLFPFTGTHPACMQERIKNVNWDFTYDTTLSKYHNMKFKHKLSFFIEEITGYRIGEYKNYKLI